MTEPSSTISYLSSSPRFPATDPLVSDPAVTPHNDTNVTTSPQNQVFHTYTSPGHYLPSTPPLFHSDEDIMEAMTEPDFPWDDMHHRAYFLPHQSHDQYAIETKDFIPNKVDWLKTPSLPLTLSKKATWLISLLPSKSTFLSNWVSKNTSLWAPNALWMKLKPTPNSSKKSVIFLPSPTQKCPDSILPLSNITSTHGLMPLRSVKI